MGDAGLVLSKGMNFEKGVKLRIARLSVDNAIRLPVLANACRYFVNQSNEFQKRISVYFFTHF